MARWARSQSARLRSADKLKRLTDLGYLSVAICASDIIQRDLVVCRRWRGRGKEREKTSHAINSDADGVENCTQVETEESDEVLNIGCGLAGTGLLFDGLKVKTGPGLIAAGLVGLTDEHA